MAAGYGFVPSGVAESNIYYYHPDHLGSSSYLTDREGRITQHTEYMAFGEVLYDEHSTGVMLPYKFNAKELDEETGLYYYGARYYDAKTSIWLNVDPLAEKTLQPYQYAYNNPLRFIDPTGMQGTDWYEDMNTKALTWFDGSDAKEGFTHLGESLQRDGFTYSSNGNVYNAQGQIQLDKMFRGIEELTIVGKSGKENNFSSQIQSHFDTHLKSSIDWGKVMNGIDAFAIGNEIKTQIMEYTVRNNYKSARTWRQFENLRHTQKQWRTINTLGKTGANYLKYAKNLGTAATIASTLYTLGETYSYYSKGGNDKKVFIKTGVDLAATAIGLAGPIGFEVSATYFVIDQATGGFGGFGEIKQNER